ncbi:MAG: serine hydrolase domain-containing protein, partial [Anaerolineae bacterium]
RGELGFSAAYGWLDPETQEHPTTRGTLFDMASVTKLFAVTAFMTLVEDGELALDQPVSEVLPELHETRPIRPYEDPLGSDAWVTVVEGPGTVDATQLTFRHLLTHTSGLPAWRPLYRQPSKEAARHMALTTFFSYPPGSRVIYSDIGLILLGIALERTTGQRLDAVIRDRVTAPLGLRCTRYLPLDDPPSDDERRSIAPTEFCRWRNRRIQGAVHDENAYRLGGVAAHAGLFSTAEEIATLGQLYLDEGGALLSASTVREMQRLQTADLGSRRGLGFLLWSEDPEASSHPFSPSTFGHTGFTGTSLWIDPERDLVVALLTNEVYNGREDRRIGKLRLRVHRAVVETVDRL